MNDRHKVSKRFGEWAYMTEGGEYHMFPLADLAQHFTESCPCHPELVDGLNIHRSFDGREDFETGARKPS